jgi:hypothetical protein
MTPSSPSIGLILQASAFEGPKVYLSPEHTHLSVHLIQDLWLAGDLHFEFCCGLINEVDGLVRKEPVYGVFSSCICMCVNVSVCGVFSSCICMCVCVNVSVYDVF